jgi:hypothetical protein
LRVGGLSGIKTERAGAARDHQSDVAVLLVIRLDGVQDGIGHLLAADRDFQVDRAGAVVEPVDVLAQAKHLAGVNADALKHAVAVKEAVVVNADFCLGFVEKLAVDVDLGHGSCPGVRSQESGIARGKQAGVTL